MTTLFHLLAEWSPFVGLVMAGWLLRTTVEKAYQSLKVRLDRGYIDDLPIGAGPWLESEARDRAMDLRVFAAGTNDKDIDAYFPSARTIQLSQEVYYKCDPSFWAVAAHELGHAIVYTKSVLLHGPLLAARVLSRSLTELGTFLIFANVLYAIPAINILAFRLLVAAAYLWAFVLIDEAAASIIAVRILARDSRIVRRGLVFACIRLFAAFMTYVAALGGQVLLILERGFIIAKIEHHRHFVAGTPLGAVALVASGLLPVFPVFFSARAVVRSLRRTKVTTAAEVGKSQLREGLDQIARGLLALPILWLVWDQPFGSTFAVACIVGLVASRPIVTLLAAVATTLIKLLVAAVVLLAVVPLIWIGARVIVFFDSSTSPVSHRIAERAPPSADVRRSEAAAQEMRVEHHNRRRWLSTASVAAFAACHIGFVAALWANLFGH